MDLELNLPKNCETLIVDELPERKKPSKNKKTIRLEKKELVKSDNKEKFTNHKKDEDFNF